MSEDPEGFVASVVALIWDGREDTASVLVFQTLNRLILESPAICDDALAIAGEWIDDMTPMIVASFLGVTFAARDRLKSRETFLGIARAWAVRNLGPDEARRLIRELSA